MNCKNLEDRRNDESREYYVFGFFGGLNGIDQTMKLKFYKQDDGYKREGMEDDEVSTMIKIKNKMFSPAADEEGNYDFSTFYSKINGTVRRGIIHLSTHRAPPIIYTKKEVIESYNSLVDDLFSIFFSVVKYPTQDYIASPSEEDVRDLCRSVGVNDLDAKKNELAVRLKDIECNVRKIDEDIAIADYIEPPLAIPYNLFKKYFVENGD
ncbi:MAG: hypothetical protein J7K26_02505 [Candidatus Aenigmarchaeota archaeon]|nr:hypothetical protein [Candidatus Aenigmarchaeota archaeon]